MPRLMQMAWLGLLDCFHAAPEGVERDWPDSHTSGSGKALRASRMPAGPFIVKRLGFSQGEVKDDEIVKL